jgi:hypothetical protein
VLNEYKEVYHTVKTTSVSDAVKLLDATKNSVYENGELNDLLQDLKKEQTPSTLKMSLEKQYVSALSNLGVLHPERITTDSLRKEFPNYIIQKKDIAPSYSVFIKPHTRLFFETVLKNIPEENITNISYITPSETDPIGMPAACVVSKELDTYEIRLSQKRSDPDIYFALTHELGHAVALDAHRMRKAGQESFGRSIVKRIVNHKKIDPYMARFYRSLEFIADTEIITQLATTNLPLAIELCEHGINSCTNHIYLDHIKYLNTGESGPIMTLTSHKQNAEHPTWKVRLLVLLKMYESLQR